MQKNHEMQPEAAVFVAHPIEQPANAIPRTLGLHEMTIEAGRVCFQGSPLATPDECFA